MKEKKTTLQDKYIAAIDVGTNSFHLIIAEIKDNGLFEIIDRQREMIRLGSQRSGDFSLIYEDEINKAIAILNNFKKLARFYKASIFAVATSAVREADNKNYFILKVEKETGIKILVLPGTEEAEIIYQGAERALNLKNKKALCIDVGGGSSEIVYADKGKIIFAESIRIGAVRMSKRFFPNYVTDKSSINICEHYVHSEIQANNKLKFDVDFEVAAGTSGTIQSIARTIYFQQYKEQPESINNYSFSKAQLEKFYELIVSRSTLDERLSIPGIEEKRADIMPAGIIILKKMFDLFRIKEMTISEYSLREGIVLRAMKKNT